MSKSYGKRGLSIFIAAKNRSTKEQFFTDNNDSLEKLLGMEYTTFKKFIFGKTLVLK